MIKLHKGRIFLPSHYVRFLNYIVYEITQKRRDFCFIITLVSKNSPLMKLKILIRRDFGYNFTIKQSAKMVKSGVSASFKSLSSDENNEKRTQIKIKHEVKLFTLETKSSKKLIPRVESS